MNVQRMVLIVLFTIGGILLLRRSNAQVPFTGEQKNIAVKFMVYLERQQLDKALGLVSPQLQADKKFKQQCKEASKRIALVYRNSDPAIIPTWHRPEPPIRYVCTYSALTGVRDILSKVDITFADGKTTVINKVDFYDEAAINKINKERSGPPPPPPPLPPPAYK